MSNGNTSPKVERLMIYVDGFNLYFGMLEAGLGNCKWLNIRKLIDNFLKPEQQVVSIKYFTSRVSNNPGKQKRQSTYLEALEAVDIEIIYGRYQVNNVECHRCGNIWKEPNEKMTDVNIATQMIIDGFENKYDAAILISGDSDLVPPIKAVHSHFADKRVTVFFPPKRYNSSVAAIAKGSLIIGRKKLADSQFSNDVLSKNGFNLRKPVDWM